MKYIITVEDEIINELKQNSYESEPSRMLLAALKKKGLDLKPLHAGSNDAELQKYFVIETGEELIDIMFLNELLSLRGITSAYAKPRDEPPL